VSVCLLGRINGLGVGRQVGLLVKGEGEMFGLGNLSSLKF
jgi:hypothetical protein